jgi:hypothetical protein
MASSLFLRIKSLNVRTMRGVASAKSVIRVAALHNLRELAAEIGVNATSGIDPSRIGLNYLLRGPDTAAGVADLAQALLDNAGVTKLRRDASMALELVFSLPQGSAVDHREYFAAAVAWADGFFSVPILSAAVHLDESAKHCHALLLPLVAGRMQGGALAGGPTKIRAMLADFQQQVGQRFGLAHQPRARRASKANRDVAGRMVLDAIKAHPERLNVPAVRDALIDALGQHHETLLPLLGLELQASKPRSKSFVEIMITPKPEKHGRRQKSIHVPLPTSIDIIENLDAADQDRAPMSMHCKTSDFHRQDFPQGFHHRLAIDHQRQQFATEIKVRAERKCGEMLRDSAERGERATPNGNVNPATTKVSDGATPSTPTLADIGITRDQSSRYQQLAAMELTDQSAGIADQHPADGLLTLQDTPTPSTTGQATSSVTAPGDHAETVSLGRAAGFGKSSDSPKAVHQLDTPATDDVRGLDAIQSAPDQEDVSISPHIFLLTASDTSPTYSIELVDQNQASERDALKSQPIFFAQHQAAPAEPASTSGTATPASRFQAISSAQPGGIGNFPDTTVADDMQFLGAMPTVPGQIKTGKAGNAPDPAADPDAPARLGSAGHSPKYSGQCDRPELSGQQHSPEYLGQLQQPGHHADDNGRHAAPAPVLHPIPAPPTASSATASQAAPGATEIQGVTANIGDFQRQRDDDRPAEHWNPDTGEFVTTTSTQARPPGRHGRAPYSARASPAETP